MASDEFEVDLFIKEYVAAIDEYHQDQCRRLIESSVGSPEETKRRFNAQTKTARQYMFAEDIEHKEGVSEAEHLKRKTFVRRYRAALLFIESYRELPLLAWPRLLVDALVEMESQMVMFRHRHARAVERIIGRRVGTGGSSGVNYLDATTSIRVFTDLWMVRTLLLPKRYRPNLKAPERYGFHKKRPLGQEGID